MKKVLIEKTLLFLFCGALFSVLFVGMHNALSAWSSSITSITGWALAYTATSYDISAVTFDTWLIQIDDIIHVYISSGSDSGSVWGAYAATGTLGIDHTMGQPWTGTISWITGFYDYTWITAYLHAFLTNSIWLNTGYLMQEIAFISGATWWPDRAAIYLDIHDALLASGIHTNLDGATGGNVTAYSGLYFTKMSGGEELGRITFPGSLDLTDSGVQMLLQNLSSGAVMDMQQWAVKFSPGAVAAMDIWATVTMNFGSGCAFVSGITSPSHFTVLSSTWAILDASSIMSNIVGTYWGNSWNISFSASHFTEFGLKPHLSAVHIVSDNSVHTAYARSWDKVTLTFTGSEALSGVIITINNQKIPPAWTGTTRSWTFTVTWWTADWAISFTIEYADIYNNAWTTVMETTDSSSVLVDNTPPVLSWAAAVTNLTSKTPRYNFTGSEAGTISYTWAGTCTSINRPTSATAWLNAMTFNALPNATYAWCKLQVTDRLGNASNRLIIPTFTVNYITPAAGVWGNGSNATGDDVDDDIITWTTVESSWSIVWSPFPAEMNDAYLYAYDIGITTMDTIQEADMTWPLIRAHMAKMMANYAINILGRAPDAWAICTFTDLAGQSTEMKGYIMLACQLGLMGQGLTGFDPNGEVTRAQFGTVLSRALRGAKYNGADPFFLNHLNALKTNNIITNTDPDLQEIRGYVMLMLYRANQE